MVNFCARSSILSGLAFCPRYIPFPHCIVSNLKRVNDKQSQTLMQVQEEEDVDPATGQPMGSSNVERFLSACQLLQLPSAAMFSVADLNSDGWEERTRITECLLTLKRYHESEQTMSITPLATRPFKSPMGTAPASDISGRFSPLQLGTSANAPKHAATPDFDLVTQQYIGASSNPLKKVAGDATAGVTRLMQQCTSMLRERMFDGGKHSSARPALTNGDMGSTMEAMGPVLESVLGSLTQVSFTAV